MGLYDCEGYSSYHSERARNPEKCAREAREAAHSAECSAWGVKRVL